MKILPFITIHQVRLLKLILANKKKMLVLYLSFLFSCLLNASFACSGLQTRRTCSCDIKYTLEANGNNLQSLNIPIKSYDDCGINLGCEKQSDCAVYCRNQLYEILSGNKSQWTQLGSDRLCNLVAFNQSISKINSNGITVYSLWKYSNCNSNDVLSSYKIAINDICCIPRCTCQIVGQSVLKAKKSVDLLIDFNDQLPKKPIGYSCSRSEFDECNSDCRNIVGNFLKNDEIKQDTITTPNFNILDASNENDITQTFASEAICKEVRNKVIHSPGMDVYIKIATDERNLKLYGKYLQLGRLCCNPSCSCELYTQNATILTQELEKNNFLYNLTENMQNKFSYNCANELSNCMNECRRRFGFYVQSDIILTNTSTTQLTTPNLDVFSVTNVGTRICDQLDSGIAPPGKK